jgi:hypothetical protein
MIDFKLKNIIIHNFACYYGLNTLNFTNDSEKNIFLFDLPNGYGKTSLFHAIKWGFYGDDIEYYKDSDRVYVEDFFCDMADITKDVCFVEINFVYGNHDYSLTRKYQPSISKSSTFLLSKDGEGINDINSPLFRLIGGIPVPKSMRAMMKFDKAIDDVLSNKKWLHVYPEASSWNYYAALRSFKKGTFNLAYKHNVPIIPFAITFRERKGLYKLFWKSEPLVTLHIGKPIFSDITLPKQDGINKLKTETRNSMLSLMGIGSEEENKFITQKYYFETGRRNKE